MKLYKDFGIKDENKKDFYDFLYEELVAGEYLNPFSSENYTEEELQEIIDFYSDREEFEKCADIIKIKKDFIDNDPFGENIF